MHPRDLYMFNLLLTWSFSTLLQDTKTWDSWQLISPVKNKAINTLCISVFPVCFFFTRSACQFSRIMTFFPWSSSVASVFIEDNLVVLPFLISSLCASTEFLYSSSEATSQCHLPYTSFWHLVSCKGDQCFHRSYSLSGWIFLFLFHKSTSYQPHSNFLPKWFYWSISDQQMSKELENFAYFSVDVFTRTVQSSGIGG